MNSSKASADQSNPPRPSGQGIPRREFIHRFGTGVAALGSFRIGHTIAGPFTTEDVKDHFVPADKKLSAEWVRSLTERGERTWYSGNDLRTIGMPVGGIGAGQVYLSGDGRLIYWDIFNRNHNTGYGAVNYKEGRLPTEVASPAASFEPALELKQGFAVEVIKEGALWRRVLDRNGFPQVRFCGEYPVGTVEYRDTEAPVHVVLEACSPFIPLDAAASTFPATLLRYTVRNKSRHAVRGHLAGWLENKVCPLSAPRYTGRLRHVNQSVQEPGLSGVSCSVEPAPRKGTDDARPSVIFADFEQGHYEGWSIEGEAFGKAPAGGTLTNQQPVSGFREKGLVNSYLGGSDQLQGRLLSPEFIVERPWISFLVGGGAHAQRTCINLLVDGKTVRTITGRDNERLTPENWSVREWIGKKARIEILDRESGGWGHINVDHIELRDEPNGASLEDLPTLADYGTMSLCYVGPNEATVHPAIESSDEWARQVFDYKSKEYGGRADAELESSLTGAVRVPFELGAGETRVLTFVLSWCFPNMYSENRRVGNAYSRRFNSAIDVARHLAREHQALTNDTLLWRDTYYNSTLPRWLLDRLHSTVSTLATATSQIWENGRFWGWEGCGCCHGTCGHVWNYEHALARLFPELERSVREMQDFAPGIGFNTNTGAIGFRGEGWDLWAGDSQAGYILKAYREHLCAANDAFLKRNWPNIRKAVEFLIVQDGDRNGLIEGRQHQTYDQDYFGPNTFVGALYLGALLAAESMASELSEQGFAKECRAIYEAGRERSMKELFNGEYFVQEVDLEKHPEWQYADGCLADQLFGQTWAHQLGLGHLYPAEAVRQALVSIWKYCWAPNVKQQNDAHPPERWFAFPGEAGLFTCTWPKSKHLGPKSTRYRDEVWTGIEYQVATNMVAEGLLTEGLAICRAVHDRYHPAKRNPWNEIECGDHYARAMASWGVLLALAGFHYHGPQGIIGFAPRITAQQFRCVFTAAEGWGSFEQRAEADTQTDKLTLRWGRLILKQVRLAVVAGATVASAEVGLGTERVQAKLEQASGTVSLLLARTLELGPGQTLEIILRMK